MELKLLQLTAQVVPLCGHSFVAAPQPFPARPQEGCQGRVRSSGGLAQRAESCLGVPARPLPRLQTSALICLLPNSQTKREGGCAGESNVLNAAGRTQRHFKVGMWSGEESVFNADLFLFELVDAYFKLLWHTVISGLLVFLCQSQP